MLYAVDSSFPSHSFFYVASLFAFIGFSATHIIVDVAQTIQQKKKDTIPLLASAPIRVNSTGGSLTLLLIRLRGTDIYRT
ncbi:hypothetical protein C5S53_12885 [Methanophagales archaeon]|nr:hypothetical protein C5S53_12885 [Methanophagales archaeon]